MEGTKMKKLNIETIKNRIELCTELKKNITEFEKLGKQLLQIDENTNFYNTDIRLLNVILENYEFGNLIFDKGYIYCVTRREEQSPYEKSIGIRNFVGKKVKWDLNLSDEEYNIQEEMLTDSDGFYDFSIYRISERK